VINIHKKHKIFDLNGILYFILNYKFDNLIKGLFYNKLYI